MEQRHHSGCVCLALHRLLVRHAPHRLGRVRLRAPEDLLHPGLQQGRQVGRRTNHPAGKKRTAPLSDFVAEAFVRFVPLRRNYVSYLIPMAIFNMAIQVFVVMSSYQSIAQKFKKTGNPKVSFISGSYIPELTTVEDVICQHRQWEIYWETYALL